MPVPAGETTGSFCARMRAEGFRPQPRHGPGAIADAATGSTDGHVLRQPTGGFLLASRRPERSSAPFSCLSDTPNRRTPVHPRHPPALQYGSVCSGIEAVSLAWQPLGLQAAWFAEIEPFPNAVLAYRYPEVPNLGDMTGIARQIRAGTVPAPDILVGGTPCQSFSVAGDRQGLADPRGALTLDLCGVGQCHRSSPYPSPPPGSHARLGKRPGRPLGPLQRLRLLPGRTGRRRPCARTTRAAVDARRLCVWTPPPHRVARARRPILRCCPAPSSCVSCGKWSRRPRSRRGTFRVRRRAWASCGGLRSVARRCHGSCIGY